MTLLLLLACTHIPKPSSGDGDARGRELVQACVEAHGGLEAFHALGDLQVRVVDVWASSAMAPEQPGDPLLTFNPALNKGLATFDEADAVWGFDSVQAWAMVGGQPAEPPRPDFVPTYGYFLSLPFKFLDPGLITEHLGRAVFDGVEVEEVLVHFEEGVGADRYLLRIDAEDHALRGVSFTFMDMNPLVQLEARLDWQDLDGVSLPQRYDIRLVRPLQRPIHVITFEDPVVLEGFDRGTYERP